MPQTDLLRLPPAELPEPPEGCNAITVRHTGYSTIWLERYLGCAVEPGWHRVSLCAEQALALLDYLRTHEATLRSLAAADQGPERWAEAPTTYERIPDHRVG